MLFRKHPEMLAGFRRGDRAVLERVYWEYVGRIERIIRHGFHVLHKGARVEGAMGEIADLVQETFARAFAERARLGFDGIREYSPFLSTIARNLLTDRARRQGREVSLELLDPDGVTLADLSEEEAPWADDRTARAVSAYLATLPPELRGVHQERYVRGASQMEAAGVLGVSRQQLRTLEKRLRDGLEKYLQAQGIDLSSTR